MDTDSFSHRFMKPWLSRRRGRAARDRGRFEVCLEGKLVEGSRRWVVQMSRLLSISVPRSCALWCALVLSAGVASSCSVNSDPLFDDVEPLAPLAGRAGNLPNFSQRPIGSGGRSGLGTSGAEGAPTGITRQGQNGAGVDGGAPGPNPLADAGSNDAGSSCSVAGDCEDGNPCTLDDCTNGACQRLAVPAGMACGESAASACSAADSCDGAGSCVPNDLPAETPCGRLDNTCASDRCDGAGACVAGNRPAEAPCGTSNGCGQPTCSADGACVPHDAANGSMCTGGSCSVGACIQGQRVGCPKLVATSVPFEAPWNSAGLPNLYTSSCERGTTADFAIEFVVPSTGRYRIDASGSPDSVVAAVNGACGSGTELLCDDDVDENSRNSRMELALTAGQTITIYVTEFETGMSGQGTLRIAALN